MLTINKHQRIGVVCHDAGGAEILSSYIKDFKEIHTCISGPALKIFKRKKIKRKLYKIILKTHRV